MVTFESMTFDHGRWKVPWYCLVYVLAVYTIVRWYLVRGGGIFCLVSREKLTEKRLVGKVNILVYTYMSFDKIFDLTTGVHFNFYYIHPSFIWLLQQREVTDRVVTF